MAKPAGVVEINGNRYDAATGKLLGAVHKTVSAIKPASIIKPMGGQVMDGFVRRPARLGQSLAKKPAQTVHKKTQKSSTIMRSVVAKPKIKATPKPDAQAPGSRRNGVVSPNRLFRAKTVLRSPKISRFQPKSSDAKETKVVTAKATPMPTRSLSQPADPIANLSHNQLERMLDHALTRADAHKQALKRSKGPMKYFRRSPRWMTVAIITVLGLSFGGFMVWRHVPALSLKLAATRAHVDASLPSYTPAGYTLAGVQSQPGAVTIEYKSKTDKSKTVTITQQATTEDNQSIKDNDVPANAPTQTYDVNGNPLIISGKNADQAVLKSGNTKIKVDNSAHLPTDEVLNTVKSIHP